MRLSVPHYTGFGIRFIAALIDLILFFVIIFNVLVFLLVHSPFSFIDVRNVSTFLFYLFVSCEIFFTARFGGTFGKLLMGCKVIDNEGKRVSLAVSFGRFFAKLLSLVLLGVGFLMILWTEKKQGLHDKLLKTYVAYDRKSRIAPRSRAFVSVLVLFVVTGFVVYYAAAFAMTSQLSAQVRDPSISVVDMEKFCAERSFFLRDRCYVTLVGLLLVRNVVPNDFLGICSNVQKYQLQGFCLQIAAIIAQERSLCDYAHLRYYKENCQRSYSAALSFGVTELVVARRF